MNFRNTVIVVILLTLVGGGVGTAQIKGMQTADGNCTASSHTAEGPIGADLTKRQSRFFCDAVVFGSFDDSKSHILVQFAEKGSHHGNILGFGGTLGEDGILRVAHLYLQTGMPPVTASDGYCKFFKRKSELGSMACGAMVNEQGRRTVAVVGFEIGSDSHIQWPGAKPEREQSSQLDCRKIVDLHGYLSRAQFQCGFARYSHKILDAARSCRSQMPDREIQAILIHAMRNFDADQQKLGSYKACKRVLDNFGQLVAQ